MMMIDWFIFNIVVTAIVAVAGIWHLYATRNDAMTEIDEMESEDNWGQR